MTVAYHCGCSHFYKFLYVMQCSVLSCDAECREKPGDEEFVKLDEMKIPFLLNFAQCQLLLNDFYPAIEHTTEVLKKDPGNLFVIL